MYRPPVDLPGVPKFGAFFVGYLVDRVVLRRSWYLSRISPVSISRDAVDPAVAAVLHEPRHGDKTEFKEAFSSASKVHITSALQAALYSLLFMLFGGLYVASALFRKMCAPWVPKPGQGPSAEVCRTGHANATNISTSDGADPVYVVTHYKGRGDPGYSHTAALLAESALSLLMPPPPGTALPPLGRHGGVLTPSTAFGQVLIERLRLAGVAEITSELVLDLPKPDPAAKKDL